MTLDQWLSWFAGDQTKELSAIHFEFNTSLNLTLCLLLLAGTGFAVFLYQWPKLQNLSQGLRGLLTGLRIAIMLLALLLILDPCLVGDIMKPGDQYVALLFDNSQSMQVNSGRNQTRGERLKKIYQREKINFEDILQKRYRLVKYQFGETIQPLEKIERLDYSHTTSDLVQSLQSIRTELDGLNVPAVILFSDGVQQSGKANTDISQESSLGFPVFTVGIGDIGPWRDVRIERLTVNRTNFDKSPVNVNAGIEIQGFAGKRLQAAIMKDDKIVQSQTLPITKDNQYNQLHFEFTPTEKEWLEYTLRVRSFDQVTNENMIEKTLEIADEERTPQNNNRSFIVDNTKKEYRILYYSSQPNWEHRFVRRAFQEDEELILSSLVLISRAQRKFVFRGSRTSLTNPLFEGFDNDEDKYGRYDEPIYLRLGLGETELVKGFPSNSEDLYTFDLLIIGDVEWTDFNAEHLKLIRDYVDQRGGSLLLLGGRDKFTSDAFSNSPIVSMLPVLPGDPSNPDELYISDFFRVQPSTSGNIAGTWALNANPVENKNEWDHMPNLYGFNLFDVTRPGSTIYSYLQDINDQHNRQPFFISQRYGNGKCAIIATEATWPWRMYQDIESNAYERLWRQWVRSLVTDVPSPIQIVSPQDSFTVNEETTLKFRIRNKEFEAEESAPISYTIQSPSQKESQPGMVESLQDAGIYTCEWLPSETGMHKMDLKLMNEDGEVENALQFAVHVDNDQREFENARYNPKFLQEIAKTSGGQFFPLEELTNLPGALSHETSQDTIQQRIHLWHNPLFYIVFVLFVSLEWYLRRKHGHP